MSTLHPVTFSGPALADLEDIKNWHIDQTGPQLAQKVITDIVSRAIKQLSQFPDSGRKVPEFKNSSYRELIQSPFRIVYRCDKEKVQVVRVWRSSRLMTGDI